MFREVSVLRSKKSKIVKTGILISKDSRETNQDKVKRVCFIIEFIVSVCGGVGGWVGG